MVGYQHLSVPVAWLVLITGIRAESTIAMDLQPAEKLQPGSTVVISCAVDRTATGYSLLWLRRQGAHSSRLASGEVFDRHQQTSRYTLVVKKEEDWDNYTLTMHNLIFEDTATIECQLDGGQLSRSRTIAVCGRFTIKEPDTVKETEDRYQGIVTGLVVCFVIVVIYAILVTIFVSRKCIIGLYSRRQKLLQKTRKPNDSANGRLPSRNPYQHADEIDIDPSEAPAWGRQPESQRLGRTSYQNPAFELKDDPPPEIHTPAVFPNARSGQHHREPGTDQRTVATVEHHQPPGAAGAAGAVGAAGEAPPPSYRSLTSEVPSDQSSRLYPTSHSGQGLGARPKHSANEVPASAGRNPPPSPSRYSGALPLDRSEYPNAASHHYQDQAGNSRTSRSRGPSSSSANGHLPNNISSGLRTPSGGHVEQHSQPATPYDAGIHGNVAPREAHSERLASKSPKWNRDATDKASYTDISLGNGVPYQGYHQGEARRQLDFSGHNVDNSDNRDAFISKTDSVV